MRRFRQPLVLSAILFASQAPAATLHGVVRDPKGQPVARARVIVFARHHGEQFTLTADSHGAYRVECVDCKKELHVETACSKCAAPDGVARALESENGFPFPSECASCASELMTAIAFVPVVVMYEGKPAKARGQTAPEDPGFHAIRVECKNCRKVMEPNAGCPLCGAA